jgi:hypothetical protein
MNINFSHLQQEQMSYCEHMHRAFSMSARMVVGAAALLVHGIFPFVFETTGSETITDLYYTYVDRKKSA